MKRYLKNLLTAVCGRNPYQLELDKVREEMEKAGENVRALQESFYRERENAAQCEKLLGEYKELMEKSDRQLASFQTLTENLRQRIKEYQDRIKEYNKVIDDLKSDASQKSQESRL